MTWLPDFGDEDQSDLSTGGPVEVPIPADDEDIDEDEAPLPEDLNFCELCGTSEDEDEELLRCEECGRLHCSNCREYDDEGTPYCAECYDELEEE
jgi:protein-arginine kinase activator protein McsA